MGSLSLIPRDVILRHYTPLPLSVWGRGGGWYSHCICIPCTIYYIYRVYCIYYLRGYTI